jgi:hypothetical protein
MYGIMTKLNIFVDDNMKDSSGEPRRGVLVFKKKTSAVTECDALNDLLTTKKTKPYAVAKFPEDEASPYGFIVDGVWKQTIKPHV